MHYEARSKAQNHTQKLVAHSERRRNPKPEAAATPSSGRADHPPTSSSAIRLRDLCAELVIRPPKAASTLLATTTHKTRMASSTTNPTAANAKRKDSERPVGEHHPPLGFVAPRRLSRARLDRRWAFPVLPRPKSYMGRGVLFLE